jgi:hypothetical protein
MRLIGKIDGEGVEILTDGDKVIMRYWPFPKVVIAVEMIPDDADTLAQYLQIATELVNNGQG